MPETPDLASLILCLKPLPAADPTAPLPPWWGRAAHALLLRVVSQYDPALANNLHESPDAAGDNPQAVRPFTASSLFGRIQLGLLDPQTVYRLRFTALNAALTHILAQASQSGPLSPGQRLELDYLPFEIIPAPAAGSSPNWEAASYAALSSALLLARDPAPRKVGLRLLSPTSFKMGGKHMPLPLPELVFGSLLEKWNAAAPVVFPPELKRYAAECLAMGRFNLHTRAVPWKGGALRIGAVGEVAYHAIHYDRYWMSLIGVLTNFAAFAGVGAGASQGLGQARPFSE